MMAFSVPHAFSDVLRAQEPRTEHLLDDGHFPNNSALPVLIYRGVLREAVSVPAPTFERIFAVHNWTGSWRNGIFGYHHYHSTTHEVLGVADGAATLKLGGPAGLSLEVEAGDVLVLPAGIAHKNLDAAPRFLVVGAYPDGRRWDLKEGAPDERPQADRNIEQVPRPSADPLYGPGGPLTRHWAPSSSAQ